MTSAIQERMLEETDRKCDWVGTRWCMVQEVLTGYTSRSIIDNDKDHFSPVFEECFNIFANIIILVFREFCCSPDKRKTD